MEAVVDVKYMPALFLNGGGAGAAVAAGKKMRPAAAAAWGGGEAGVYRECLKNHAASLGGHALDGCGEFMPSSAGDPASLQYAAVPQVGRDSRALHGEEMPQDRSRPPSTARLRRRISATIFLHSLL